MNKREKRRRVRKTVDHVIAQLLQGYLDNDAPTLNNLNDPEIGQLELEEVKRRIQHHWERGE